MEESFLITLPGDAEQICWVFAGFHQEITSEMGEPRCCQGLAEALLLSSPPVLSSRAGAALTLCPRADPLCYQAQNLMVVKLRLIPVPS